MKPGRHNTSFLRPLAVGLVLTVLVVIVVGIFLASYAAGLAFLLGAMVALIGPDVLNWLRRNREMINTWLDTELTLTDLAVLLALIAVLLLLLTSCAQGAPSPPRVPISKYIVVVEPVDTTLASFKLQEKIFLEETISNGEEPIPISLPARQVMSTSRGLLLRELYIAPLNCTDNGQVDLFLPLSNRDIRLVGSLCGFSCPASSVELSGFPKDSFYAAKDVEGLKQYPYVDVVTITWSVRDLERGITFAYLPPPYYHLRVLLSPFVGITRLGQLGIALIGFLSALVVSPVLKPVFFDVAQEKLKSWLDRVLERKSRRKATLIISDKGEEKEIEITDDS